MAGVLGVFTGADCLADGLGAIPHDPLPKTRYDMKLAGRGRRSDLHRPAPAVADRQGAPRRRSGCDGGGRDGGASARCRRGGGSRLRGAAPASIIRRTRWRRARPRSGTRSRTTWQSIPASAIARQRIAAFAARRPRRRLRLPHRPGHRGAARAAGGARRTTRRRAAATRSMPAAAARCGRSASSPPCSASRPKRCASSPMTSAAISAPATGCLSSSGWCCGRRASSAARSSSPPRARRPS